MIDSSESAKDMNDHFQTILTSNWINILSIEFEIESEYEINLYQHVHLINQKNELCNEYWQAMNKDELKLHDMKLKNCQIIDNVLFKKKSIMNVETNVYEIALKDSRSIINLALWH